MNKIRPSVLLILVCTLFSLAIPAGAEVMLQWFESDWDEMYQKMPLVAQTGYDWLWIPPPTKGPVGRSVTWANVGYNLYDRFDIGDIPQRGTLETRYGTRGSLNAMIDAAHGMDIKIIPDIVMNHNGNGPDLREYPGMTAEDFHVKWSANYAGNLNYERAPRMNWWYHHDGYGGTMWSDLANLADIRTEDHPLNGAPLRFTGPQTDADGNSFDFVGGRPNYIRHIGQYDKYPYAYTNELVAEMLYRWIAWLGDAIDYDGLRIDAAKHTPYEFFGWRGAGFLHEAQWNFSQRRGHSFGGDPTDLFQNYVLRTNALLFAEILSPWSEIEYWHGFGSNDRNPMRFLDYAVKKHLDSKFNGDMNGLGSFGSNFDETKGIYYAWGHDEGGASKIDLAYAYILTHVGFPMVYYTGNNITWADHGRAPWPTAKTWMIPGYDSKALGEQYNHIANLVWIHQNFTRGREYKRWENDGDFFALERYDDTVVANGSPDAGEGLVIVALNDSGWDQTRTLTTCFPEGAVLKDYTGNSATEVTVSGGQVTITVPGNSGQGWVCYAPKIADPVNVRVLQGGSDAPTMTWIIPGGVHQADTTQQITRITATNVTVETTFTPPAGGTVDNVMLKWGRGVHLPVTNYFSEGRDVVSGHFHDMNRNDATNYSLGITITETNLPEGLNVIKCRAFNQRTAGYSALFNTATKVVYVDRRGPDLALNIAESQSMVGEFVLVITNSDLTAYGMTVSVNGGAANSADEVMKGLWKYGITGLSAGTHTVVVTATEADYAATRQIINTGTLTRVFQITDNYEGIGFNHSADAVIELPFFQTVVTGGSESYSSLRIFWDGYELPFNGGSRTNVFNGEILFRDPTSAVTNRFWGNFVNGPHYFEAERVDGIYTSRVVRRVVFDLYGNNHIDSDGDGLPDNVEMPFFDQGAPGPDQPWPGDSNNNFIPESWETWTRLNPYNHATFYGATWDDQLDSDGDGYNNYAEVYAGYVEDGNIYKYSIYDAGSFPSGTPMTASDADWTPTPAVRGSTLTVTYYPNEGALDSASQVWMHVGHSKKTMGDWQDVYDTNMTVHAVSNWQVTVTVPTNATSVDFTFWDGTGTWDGKDWQADVLGFTNVEFSIDGTLDSTNYLVFGDNMYIWAAVNGDNLYVATWGVGEELGNNDHFIYVTDELGSASDPAPGWNKAGLVFFDTAEKPYLTAEGENDWEGWNNITADAENGTGSGKLEGEINLINAFGSVPEAVYIAAVAYGTADSGGIASQGPYSWNGDDNLDITEFLRVPIASIRDDDLDGHFDGGNPAMWTVTGSDTNDANYGLHRTFINELANETEQITVILEPRAGAGNTLSNVELFSNLNRRDFAVLEEDPDSVTTTSGTNYYRAYSMTDLGGGRYSCTLDISKCGAYRINARWRVNGGDYVYYSDGGMRRDCAVVVSPKKALRTIMYEMNPMFAEATNATFYGRSTFEDVYVVNTDRPNRISTNVLADLGINMIWLQPIHPIGSDNRENDPSTGLPYDPGSPYAVKNYWKVNAVLGDPSSDANAMNEFSAFVGAMDNEGIGVMLDGTFNHSAWDCEIGSVGVDMFAWATSAGDYIRDIRPQWYSKRNDYGSHASHYESLSNNDIAPAPDRMDFGKWNDAADFYFGTYDALVQAAPMDTNWAWSSPWYSRYLLEEDRFDGHDTYTREIWEYFAYYPTYWLEKTGHPDGTPKSESHKGIDGLRCDFAQGLPSEFWEYTINKTRSVKWDFLFMAESLDGYSEVNGSKHHGVGYRSARHFDILNENMVYYWRDSFFAEYSGGSSNKGTPNRTTSPTQTQFDNRKDAFRNVPLLLNLTSHDDVYSTYHQPSIMHAYAAVSAMGGVPMIMYGQEAGAQNDYNTYNRGSEIDGTKNNFAFYESNFGKSIVNFKRYNCMTSVWHQGATHMGTLRDTYGKISRARQNSPALQSQNDYFLSTTAGGKDESIFAVAKYEAGGISAATQDVVLVFVNNDCQSTNVRSNVYTLDGSTFGIEDGKYYNVVNLLGSNPTNLIWSAPGLLGSVIKTNFFVSLNGEVWDSNEWQIQYLKLIDTTASYPKDDDGLYAGSTYSTWDSDGDGLPDDWESANSLNPNSSSGDDGADGDPDNDDLTNAQELLAGTNPQIKDALELGIDVSGSDVDVWWDSITDINYMLQRSDSLTSGPGWETIYFGTAIDTNAIVTDTTSGNVTSRYYRAVVVP